MATKNKETIIKKKIRKYIRDAIRWNKVDNGMPTHWSSDDYKRAKKMKGMILKKSEQHYVYYTRSERAIKEIAEKIYKLVKKNNHSKRPETIEK